MSHTVIVGHHTGPPRIHPNEQGQTEQLTHREHRTPTSVKQNTLVQNSPQKNQRLGGRTRRPERLRLTGEGQEAGAGVEAAAGSGVEAAAGGRPRRGG